MEGSLTHEAEAIPGDRLFYEFVIFDMIEKNAWVFVVVDEALESN